MWLAVFIAVVVFLVWYVWFAPKAKPTAAARIQEPKAAPAMQPLRTDLHNAALRLRQDATKLPVSLRESFPELTNVWAYKQSMARLPVRTAQEQTIYAVCDALIGTQVEFASEADHLLRNAPIYVSPLEKDHKSRAKYETNAFVMQCEKHWRDYRSQIIVWVNTQADLIEKH